MAYNDAVVKLGGSNARIIVLDGDSGISTYSEVFRNALPDRYIECYIAEQNLVGVGIGCAARDRNVVFCNGFGAFLTRAFDQIRMGAISSTNLNFAWSHVGVCIDLVTDFQATGTSHTLTPDVISIPGSTVFSPSDAVSKQGAVELTANIKGICYIRSSRTIIPVIYDNDEIFEVGKAKVVRKSSHYKVTLIGSCVTLVEAFKAAGKLEEEGINVRIIDPFTVKPLDKDTILTNARETGGNIITVEDHYIWGGLGDSIAGALSEERGVSIKNLAVREVSQSGKPEELMEKLGISASCIIAAVKQ